MSPLSPQWFASCGCADLWKSAKQLRKGFPLITMEHPVTDAKARIFLRVHQLVLLIPFLWEIRTAFDWALTRTSLSLKQCAEGSAVHHIAWPRRVAPLCFARVLVLLT
jgi:hypothetical protein